MRKSLLAHKVLSYSSWTRKSISAHVEVFSSAPIIVLAEGHSDSQERRFTAHCTAQPMTIKKATE